MHLQSLSIQDMPRYLLGLSKTVCFQEKIILKEYCQQLKRLALTLEEIMELCLEFQEQALVGKKKTMLVPSLD